MKHRTSLVLTATGAALLAATAPAMAHDSRCNPETRMYEGDFAQAGPVTFTMNADGTYTARWAGDGFTRTKPQDPRCAPLEPVPAPVPPVPEDTPTAGTPGTVAPLTCAELLRRYPKAGKVRRASWGCPTRRVKLPPRPDKPSVTCSFARSHYSGAAERRMLLRHGCWFPSVTPRGGRVAVTG